MEETPCGCKSHYLHHRSSVGEQTRSYQVIAESKLIGRAVFGQLKRIRGSKGITRPAWMAKDGVVCNRKTFRGHRERRYEQTRGLSYLSKPK